MNWFKTNLVVGIGTCLVYSVLAFGGVKSPFGEMFKSLNSGSSGRSGSGFFYYGGGK